MGLPFFNDLCSFVHKEATFFIDYILYIPVSYIIKLLFIYSFIFYTGPILIAVFITEMVILFKHVIIIIIIIIIIITVEPHLAATSVLRPVFFSPMVAVLTGVQLYIKI